MKDNIPPEEKLLRLIRGQKKPAPAQAARPLAPPEPKAAVSKPDFKTPLFFILRRSRPFLSLNRIIATVFIISCFYLAASFAYPLLGFRKNMFSKITPKPQELPEFETGQEIMPYEFYLQGVRNKQVFSSTPEEESEKMAGAGNSELVKDIYLLGIIAGENPQAVLEDKKERKTYYLAEGEYLGAFQVKDIQEGKVILSYGGKNYELRI